MKVQQIILLLLISGIASCSQCGHLGGRSVYKNEHPPTDNTTPRITIKWDTAAKKISHDVYFAEYGRVKRFNKDTLLLIYHCGKKGNEWDNIVLRRSTDNGKTWLAPQTVVADNQPKRYYGFATPDLITLKNGWLLLAYTGKGIPDDSTHNNIQVRLSKDAGNTWSKPAIIASGRSWEPGMVQLPDGEVEIFFSTEISSSKAAKGRHEQKVVMMASNDNGLHWQKPRIVAFMHNRRDGMPTPLVLNNNKGIVFAIETVYNDQSPCMVWSSTSAKWRYDSIATEENGRRWCGTSNVWGGAPWLLQLPSGETVISVQDDGGRPIDRFTKWKKSTMVVLMGNSMAKKFTNTTYPWPNLPTSEGAYFNSIFLKNDSTVVAVSTRNFKDEHSEIWWKEGHVERKISAAKR